MVSHLQAVRKPRPDEKLGDYLGVKQYAPRKLDIACGQNKAPGFKGIDLAGDADIIHDLFRFPWPIKANSVQEVFCSHFVEHIPHYLPEWNGVDGFVMFFNELYRICKKGATLRFVHPYVWNDRAFWDPTHVRYVHEMNYTYLDPDWRKLNLLDHYGFECDFEVVTINAGVEDEIALKNDQAQAFARKYYKNAIGDLEVILRCRK